MARTITTQAAAESLGWSFGTVGSAHFAEWSAPQAAAQASVSNPAYSGHGGSPYLPAVDSSAFNHRIDHATLAGLLLNIADWMNRKGY